MRQTELIMGMPITVEIVGAADDRGIRAVFDRFRAIDRRFSTYKPNSEISRVNRGLPRSHWSKEMVDVLARCQHTKRQTNGYFDIVRPDQTCDPSGLVKGWAIQQTAELLDARGCQDFYIDAGGDIQTRGHNSAGGPWQVGIRNPFSLQEIVQVVGLSGEAIATSGTYIRGEHIYNPRDQYRPAAAIASMTVIGPTIYDADRFATAAFAMGGAGIAFIASIEELEGYMIDKTGVATYTSHFKDYAGSTVTTN